MGRVDWKTVNWPEGEEAEEWYARKRGSNAGYPMKLRLLSWNVRGANDSSKRKVVKAMIRSQKVDLFCLQETKIQVMDEGVVRSLGTGRFLEWGLWMLMALRVAKECGGWVCLDLHRGGDFNVVLSQRERSSQGRISGAMRRFAQVAEAHIGSFSYYAEGGGLRRGPSPFRFENMWLKVDGFKDLLREWWQGTVVRGKASFRLASKLKVLKQKIKEWNREVFGRLEVNKSLALQQVEFWDRVESERSLNPLETNVEGVVAEGGGQNSGFFHRMANAHRRTNSMDRIKINGVWRTEEQEVREGIVQNFQQLLTEEPSWRADIEGLHLPRLNTCEAEGLEVPFTMEEIHSALMDMNGDKAPGPDGFTGAFWQTCWEFVKEEIMDLFKEFFVQKSFAKSLNTIFLVLIPKKGERRTWGVPPISLLGDCTSLWPRCWQID
ncbi:hypothetical protein CK203_036323 [Vitis vinifera]|uniref:Endonuclease/exonuclease/phosphatase domain-containing protein n=1 Tax=Vitis vinifera TaxID=29760 RepID=A0A438HT08_VITVI|nr:hypothetical protein CK203_036323 [Vitis vinifera]